MKKITNSKGITLIALIITIIVMLILVGVTINIAMNEGLFNKSREARSGTQIQADKEKLLSAITASYDAITGIVDGEKLETELGEGWQVTGTGPYTVTSPKGSEFTVETNGNFAIANVGGNNNQGGNDDPGEEDNTPATYAKASELTLGTNVSLVAYEDLEAGDIKTAVDSGKVKAVLTETISGTPTIAVIPTGFSVSTTSGENTISGGLVVEDGSHNQFVWIPVPTLSQMAVETEANSGNYRGVLYDWNTDSTGSTAFSYSANSGKREPANLTATITINNNSVAYDSQEAFTEYGGGTYTSTMYQTEFNSMVQSVAKYKGFYVGRYETGGFNGSTIVVKAGETGTTNSSSANNSINYTNWYKMYQMQKDFASSNANVASTMIWGCQYDQVMKFIDDKLDGAGNTYDVTTYSSARHTNSLAATGNNTNDKVQNIYDLEGNIYEWTLEASNTLGRVRRGGSDYDSNYSANRVGSSPYVSLNGYVREPYHTLHKEKLK